MPRKLIYTRTAVKDIKKLDSVAKKRIEKRLEVLANNPLKYAKKLSDKKLGSYRWRVGNYRIIFDLDKNKIVILRIAHRREVYN